MLRNIVSFIFIYIFIISCDNSVFGTQECSNCILELSIPELEMDNNGYYHLEFNENYIQSFARIQAYVGHGYEYIGWTSNTEHCVDMWNEYTSCNNVVNGASYSGSDGYAYTMLGVHEEHIGDIIKVYCGYYDDYGVQYIDSIKVVVDE